MEKLFKNFLILSENMRKGYIKSLDKPKINWKYYIPNVTEIPLLYSIIYSNVQGTKREVKEQQFMDFIPGYRLIHISELLEENICLENIIKSYDIKNIDIILPLLSNYSSDYICYVKTFEEQEYIVGIFHDDIEIYVMHNSVKDFFVTILEFYKQGVYFIDEDGYLDYDMDKEMELGQLYNKNLTYWLN